MENTEYEQVYSEKVIKFVTVANEFCTFLENAKNFTRKDLKNNLLSTSTPQLNMTPHKLESLV